MKGKKLVLLFIAIFVLGIFTGGVLAYGKNTDGLSQSETAPEPPKSPEEMTEEELEAYVENLEENNEEPSKDEDLSKNENVENNKQDEEEHTDTDNPDAMGTVRPASSNNVNVRSGAGKDYAVVAKVQPGDKVKIIGQSDDWYQVELTDGTKGWMAEFLLDVDWGMDNV